MIMPTPQRCPKCQQPFIGSDAIGRPCPQCEDAADFPALLPQGEARRDGTQMPQEDWSDYASPTGPDARQADNHGWLPIESAPKDGTPIWLRGNGIYHGIEFVGERRTATWPWDEDHWWNLNGQRRVPDHCLTYWMPRPAPPEDE